MNHKENRVFKFALSIVCLLVVTLGQATAGPIVTVPTSLSPGDSYRLAFLTSQERDATSSNIDVYNTFVDGLGDLVIASDWRAIASTPTVDARDNTGTNPITVGVPIFLLNDTLLANNNADLWDGDIINPLTYTDLGDLIFSTVWTGTNVDGASVPGFELGEADTYVGRSLSADDLWIAYFPDGVGDPLALYAMSGNLVMPGAVVPEPSSLMLLGIGAVGLLGYRLRRKRGLSPATS